MQTRMAQGRSPKMISMMTWIRTNRLSLKHCFFPGIRAAEDLGDWAQPGAPAASSPAGSGFRVQDAGFRIQGLGYRVQGSRFRVQGSGCRVHGAGFRVQDSRLRDPGDGAQPAAPAASCQFQPLPRSSVGKGRQKSICHWALWLSKNIAAFRGGFELFCPLHHSGVVGANMMQLVLLVVPHLHDH